MAKKTEEKKIFVLDTNIPMQDPNCLLGFKEHDIAIPITVIEELDKFKKGTGTINLNTRSFQRLLDKYINNPKSSTEGVSLGKGLGKVFIALGSGKYPKIMEESFMNDIPDHRILATALSLQKKKPDYEVILVTNDQNLKFKAMAIGINTEPYRNETVADMDKIFSSIEETTLTDKEWTQLYAKPPKPKKKESFFDNKTLLLPSSLKKFPVNHLFIIKGGDDSNFRFLARKTEDHLIVIQEDELKIKEVTPRNNEQTFALSALLDPTISLIAITGKAGTGKTLVALAAAIHQKNKPYKEILVARPAMEMSDKTLGFLPGSKEEKIDPYMMPIYDNLAVIKERIEPEKNQEVHDEPIREWARANQIEVLVLNYIRGRSLAERFIIIDEAQNLTPHEIKTIVTRAGEGTKIVVIGDISQIDSPYQNERSNGLSYLIDKWKGEPEFVHVHMVHGERSPLADKAGRIM